MSTRMAVTPDKIMQLGLGFWGSKTLLSAIELGLFTELAAGPLNEQELTEHLKLHPRATRDFFDALVALGMLANIRAHLGSLDRVVRFAKVVGRVNVTPEFMGHAQVIDGYTDLMVSVFGDSALCARSAPGMGSAPFQVAVIADAILQVR